jgi:hypothetical protein
MGSYEAALAALSRIEESFTRIEEGESNSKPPAGKKPAERVRRPPQFVYVNLPDSKKLDAARAALRDVEEWVDEALTSIPADRRPSLHAGCREALAEVRSLVGDHEARVLRGVEAREDIDALRRLVEDVLARRMFDLRDCIERLNRARAEPTEAAPPSGRPAAGAAASPSVSPGKPEAQPSESKTEMPKRPVDFRRLAEKTPRDFMVTRAELMDALEVKQTKLYKLRKRPGFPTPEDNRYDLVAVCSWCDENDVFCNPARVKRIGPKFDEWLKSQLTRKAAPPPEDG